MHALREKLTSSVQNLLHAGGSIIIALLHSNHRRCSEHVTRGDSVIMIFMRTYLFYGKHGTYTNANAVLLWLHRHFSCVFSIITTRRNAINTWVGGAFLWYCAVPVWTDWWGDHSNLLVSHVWILRDVLQMEEMQIMLCAHCWVNDHLVSTRNHILHYAHTYRPHRTCLPFQLPCQYLYIIHQEYCYQHIGWRSLPLILCCTHLDWLVNGPLQLSCFSHISIEGYAANVRSADYVMGTLLSEQSYINNHLHGEHKGSLSVIRSQAHSCDSNTPSSI